MPGIVTHHMFGIDVHKSLAKVIGDSAAARDAFLLGNQGPDPFFYLMVAPTTHEFRRIGQIMHRQKTVELLANMHRYLINGCSCLEGKHAAVARTDNHDDAYAQDVTSGEVCKAYALGFLCHYLLDSTVHPLVFAQEYAICSAGVEGLSDDWSHRVVHATIETSLDEYVLTTKLGSTAATLPPHKMVLPCSASALSEISRQYSNVLRETYNMNAPETVFYIAVSLNRFAQRALDSKSGGLRQHYDYLGFAGMASAYVQALSHRAKLLPYTPFANNDHTLWKTPFATSGFISESFDELYTRAYARAIEILPEYVKPTFGLDACKTLVDNVNFLGRRD